MESWNKQFADWYAKNEKFKTVAELAKETGIPRSTLTDYMHKTQLAGVKRERAEKLYAVTGLECFKPGYVEPKETASVPEAGSQEKRSDEGLDYPRLLDMATSVERQVGEIRKAIQKQYPQETKRHDDERTANHVINLLEELALSLEPFRTGDSASRKVLVEKIKRNSETYVYFTQMLNAMQQEDSTAWLRLTQPPHIVRKILGDKR